ncbi:MAG TPA: glycosyl hydrolase 115 family protein [Puia sp.]|nr:glycosyl hydrolase 115 family protein [Puia sp.]
MRTIFTVLAICFVFTRTDGQNFISEREGEGAFPVVAAHGVAAIATDEADFPLIKIAGSLLQQDIQRVTDSVPEVIHSFSPSSRNIIVIGTVTGSALIRKLIDAGKFEADGLRGKWEAYQLQVVHKPFKGIDNALVIAGSDRRGAAYGVFTLSREMGVSPWYWWADVPVKKRKAVYVKAGTYRYGPPSVKYRGIFLNDEAPALSGWVHEKFGNFDHRFYEKVFELLLRLKANYLWPAMWGNAFNNDDSLNPVMADEYGIVMGTSHQEPMNQATEHWRHAHKGPWDYTTNDSVLRDFWKQGIEHMDHRETIVTLGMRGDGDKPMTEGTAIDLLERIVADQRKIIADVTGKPASETPQDWALYKEVQDYYDKGMRVPDDVTLLLSDDNWGDIRRLPGLSDEPRSGGYGIYYHFDYVGGPRNYKWLNTNNISRVWEQLHLAYAYDARKIWVVNVGDLKPMEFPISFFLDYAWNVNKWNEDNLDDYYTKWASEQFGAAYAKDIGEIIQKYTQFNARRKPELLNAGTYSLLNYNESDRVRRSYDSLAEAAEAIGAKLPDRYKEAFFELVLHPVTACANLQDLYTAVAWNQYYARQNNPMANKYADEAKRFYTKDSLISAEYNHMNDGEWDHMMDQTHIGYRYWQEPRHQTLPAVSYIPGNAADPRENGADSGVSRTGASVRSAEALVPKNTIRRTFYEKNGYVSIEAAHYTEKTNAGGIRWKIIPGIGRDGDGITSFPVTAKEKAAGATSPHIDFDFYCYDTGAVKLNAYFSPTLNFEHDSTGLQYAISIDGEKPQTVAINKDDANQRVWGQWVSNDIIIKTTAHTLSHNRKHTIRFWRVSPAVVLQKIVVNCGGEKPSYLGPPETLSPR